MTDSPHVLTENNAGLLRITIPYGSHEKIWMTIALTVMLLFGTMMSLIAEYAARSATTVRALWAIPFVVLGIIGGFYLLCLLAIRAMTGSVVEFDGKTLSVGSIGSERRTSWNREEIKSIHVSRLPMVPVANLVIQTTSNPSMRTGVCRKRELEAVAVTLKNAIGLRDRK